MVMASVTVRAYESTKLAANNIADDFGFDLSSVTRAFYKQIVRERRIPLNFEYPKPNRESLQSIKDVERVITDGEPGYADADDMFASIGA
jgi:DNA-damage-inducible protein J